nr:miraculin-like isoform X1 [Ipomoea trifida]
MKTQFFLLSLFLFSILLCEVIEAQDTNAVLDIRGKILRAGVKYYVVPLLQDQGGGLDLTSTDIRLARKVWSRMMFTGGMHTQDARSLRWRRKGNPGQQTLSNWFKIVKTTNAYKFMFCPSVCDDCSYVCQDVGISKKRGQRRLVLSNTPLEINFKKA